MDKETKQKKKQTPQKKKKNQKKKKQKEKKKMDGACNVLFTPQVENGLHIEWKKKNLRAEEDKSQREKPNKPPLSLLI